MKWFVTRVLPLVVAGTCTAVAAAVFLTALVVRCWETPW